MKVYVRNARDRKFTSILKLACDTYARRLFKRQMLPNLVFHIHIHEKLGYNGLCGALDLYKPREFEIDLARQRNKLNMMATLAHEMVHAKQFAYGEMRDRYIKRRMVTLWKGEDYSHLKYWDQPWEIEAYGLEPGLLAHFLNQHKLYAYFKTPAWLWSEDHQ